MPDTSFDVVIVGGGNKALFLAMYLMKYGGMSVGVFERRHEIGGCLATEDLRCMTSARSCVVTAS
jgi:phytoene dehydrogenase-like protein